MTLRRSALALVAVAGCQYERPSDIVGLICGPGSLDESVELDGIVQAVCVQPSPDNALTLVVTWHTDAPATSTVEFGEDGVYAWQLGQDGLVTEHEVTIWGLHADTDVVLRVRSELDDGTLLGSGDLASRTGTLPESVPDAFVGAWDPALAEPGWTLLNISNQAEGWPPTAVLYDAAGKPVWYTITHPAETDFRGDLDVSLTPTGTILVGGSGPAIAPVEVDMTGEVVWRGPLPTDVIQHHHLEKLADGTYIMLRQAFDAELPGLHLDEIVQIDAAHDTLWSWNAFDHLDIPEDATGDYTHMNSITVDGEHVYVNSRELSTLFKLDRDSGEILWRLGADRDFAPDPDAETPWFEHQHAPELQDDGSWLVYDNDGLEGDHTRVLQVALDEATLAAEVIWQFPGDAVVDSWYADDWHSWIWGDADRLDNGNVLVTAGTRDVGDQSRVFEVTPAGEVVWEMLLPAEGEDVVGTYRAERIDPPGLEPVELAP